MAFEQPWTVDMAPEKYIDTLKKAITGIEILITKLQGKWKISQEEGNDDRHGVEEGLRRTGTDEACAVANIVKERDAMKVRSSHETMGWKSDKT